MRIFLKLTIIFSNIAWQTTSPSSAPLACPPQPWPPPRSLPSSRYPSPGSSTQWRISQQAVAGADWGAGDEVGLEQHGDGVVGPLQVGVQSHGESAVLVSWLPTLQEASRAIHRSGAWWRWWGAASSSWAAGQGRTSQGLHLDEFRTSQVEQTAVTEE